jgi:hypothetical protein
LFNSLEEPSNPPALLSLLAPILLEIDLHDEPFAQLGEVTDAGSGNGTGFGVFLILSLLPNVGLHDGLSACFDDESPAEHISTVSLIPTIGFFVGPNSGFGNELPAILLLMLSLLPEEFLASFDGEPDVELLSLPSWLSEGVVTEFDVSKRLPLLQLVLAFDPLLSCLRSGITPPPKRPPLLIVLWLRRPTPIAVLAPLPKQGLLKIPDPLPVARPNSPGVLVVLRSPMALLLVPNREPFWLFEASLTWLLRRRDVSSELLDGVGVSIRVYGADELCLSGVIGLPKI